MIQSDWKLVNVKLQKTLEDWEKMQRTTGDEGAEWAERFERHFYEMIEAVKDWYEHLNDQPDSYEQFESMSEIEEIQNQLPGPLLINFLTELEDIYDGIKKKSYD
ncbi:DUF4085 domain-containing protein [Pseudalkalibacillus berkeleyi]|uniref:DUF4085 domain-containing protein n=1 Tax=Pseudalkalibacillus berkeleyi TaxID=1069813 RepID=A0ABS9H0L4_9BACL|nr:DUF4085 domain-containing protein [Pseudalkalibacillus berkeleyi]MCF6137303.1 DUF4085 domain-containing protein [Pseudalkalibacillus berkeleyi]